MSVIEAIVFGMVVVLVGTIPRNVFFEANLHFYPGFPWAVPITGAYLLVFWRYLSGKGPPKSTSETRRLALRANRISGGLWFWALVAGGLAIVTLVLTLKIVNRIVVLPEQSLPGFEGVPRGTVLSLLLAAAPIAGIIEESAFRGYMQGPIERRFGLVAAIVITGTMFAIAHLDFTFILWPYYVAVAAIYSTVTRWTDSILPAIVLHTCGNLYSNLDLWLHGKAEWQAAGGAQGLIWNSGVDEPFRLAVLMFGVFLAATLWAFFRLRRSSSLST